MSILHVVGARPNFMKAAPVMRALAVRGASQFLVHTGQHYDANMSDVFFEQLGLPAPDINLGVGSGSHAEQTAQVMLGLEPVLREHRPDLVMLYGDVNSTLAAALVSTKLNIRVVHVEAGLRSRDRTMPEEINRILTDHISDILFTPSADADSNLLGEGIAEEKICRVGNVMIDTLVCLLPRAEELSGFAPAEKYALLTLHRPANVDDLPFLYRLLRTLQELSLAVVFPVHPRTRKQLGNLMAAFTNRKFHFVEPLPYLEFLALQRRATAVITDSGGVQEETTFLNVPCLTMRENTERPITVSLGSNTLVGRDLRRLRNQIERIRAGHAKQAQRVPLWDGCASERIAAVLVGQAVAASA